MKTYVINMLKDTCKRAAMELQLADHPELEYKIWEAVEGRQLTEQEQERDILPDFRIRYGKNATLPAAGCSLSHICVYNDIIKSNTPYALILEDDAILLNDLKLNSLIDLLSSTKPIAILLTPDFWYHKRSIILEIDSMLNVYEVCEGYMTSGYLINKKGAELLARLNYPVQYTADDWSIFKAKGLTLYGVVPHLVSFPDGLGEIGLSIKNTPHSLLQKIHNTFALLYVRSLSLVKYMRGFRKSKKEWR